MADKIISGLTDGEIAQLMKQGGIIGPVVTNNCLLLNVRITGTGDSVRTYKDVDRVFIRPPGVFLSDKFLAMCNGLPCAYYNIDEGHPTDGELDYDNWKKYIAGTIILPYVDNQEVWGIAKIFDPNLVKDILAGKILSTSPFVTSPNFPGKDGIITEGKIEEKLEDLNHVAFVQAGHWDHNAQGPAIKIGEIMWKEDKAADELAEKDKYKMAEELIDSLREEGLEKSDAEGNIRALQGWANKHTHTYVAEKLKGKVSDPHAVANWLLKGDSEKKVDKDSSDGVYSHPVKKTGGDLIMTQEEILAQFKADAAIKDTTIKSLTDKLAEKDELIRKADDDKKKADDDKKKKDEEAAPEAKKKEDDDKKKDDDDRKKKDDEYAKMKDDLAKKDAEIAELKKPKVEKKDAVNPLSPIKEKIDAMVTRLGDAADPAIKGIQEEVNKLISHEAQEGELHEELLGDDDEEKEKYVNAVSELADSAHSEIKVNQPAPKKEGFMSYLHRVLRSNLPLFSKDFHFLKDGVNKDNLGVAKMAFVDMEKNVKAKTAELNGRPGSGAIVAIRNADGSVTYPHWGDKRPVI